MDDRRKERARRRAEWLGEVVEPGTAKGRLYETLSPTERLAALTRLNRRAWIASGGAELEPIDRSEWPGEILELRRG